VGRRCLRARFCNGSDVFGTCYCRASGTPHSCHLMANQRCAFYFSLHVAMATRMSRPPGQSGPLLARRAHSTRVIPQPSVAAPRAYLIGLDCPTTLFQCPASAGMRILSFVTTLRLTLQLGASAAMATDTVAAGFPCTLYVTPSSLQTLRSTSSDRRLASGMDYPANTHSHSEPSTFPSPMRASPRSPSRRSELTRSFPPW
jgi:hypothetical protein